MSAMTKEEKIQFLNECEQKLMNGSVLFIQGYNAYSAEIVNLMTEGVITLGIEDQASRREWLNGFRIAEKVTHVKHDLKTQKVITFNEVLAANRKDSYSTCNISMMLYHNMFPIIENLNTEQDDDDFPLIKVQVIFEDDGDGERTRELGVVSYEGVDVMLYNCSGRGGYEYNDSFIVNEEKYIQAVAYIQKIILQNEISNVNVVRLEDDAEHLINFYGFRLEMFGN